MALRQALELAVHVEVLRVAAVYLLNLVFEFLVNDPLAEYLLAL
jgi:hypothetical protein